jgi:hypothetical protein
MARPEGTIISFNKEEFTSWDILNTALSYNATLEECSHLLEVSEHTIINRIRETYDVTFKQYSDRFVCKSIVKFRQELHKMACSGKHPAVTIFYAKNRLGMSDKTDVNLNTKDAIVVSLAYSKKSEVKD